MKLYNIYGKVVNKNVLKYRVDWEANSKSKLQHQTKQFLKKYWKNHIVYEEFPVFGSRMKVDFVNATKKIAIEVHGPQHSEFNKFFHNNSRLNYLKSIKRDVQKENWLVENNFTFVEVYFDEVELLSEKYFKEKYSIIL
jgi:very-short-patch-repair endonuclease